jgi:hypothetical protein
VLGTPFFLMPLIGSRAIGLALGIVGILAGAVLIGAGAAMREEAPAPGDPRRERITGQGQRKKIET